METAIIPAIHYIFRIDKYRSPVVDWGCRKTSEGTYPDIYIIWDQYGCCVHLLFIFCPVCMALCSGCHFRSLQRYLSWSLAENCNFLDFLRKSSATSKSGTPPFILESCLQHIWCFYTFCSMHLISQFILMSILKIDHFWG